MTGLDEVTTFVSFVQLGKRRLLYVGKARFKFGLMILEHTPRRGKGETQQ